MAFLSSYGISLRTNYDIRHGIAKILSLKFFRSPAVPSLFGISLKTAYDVAYGLAKISNLNFLKGPEVLSSCLISLSTAYDMDLQNSGPLMKYNTWKYENLKS